MANYTKSTDFASKDALLSGDPNKIVKGSELDDEFDNIQTAVNSKADANSATLTGTPTAPTASSGTNTTQIATTAFVTTAVTAAAQAAYPVGSIYMNASVSTNPGTLLGFGTWTAFGAGRVLIGVDGSNALFDTVGETGGSADAVVVSHTHTASTSTAGNHRHQVGAKDSTANEGGDTSSEFVKDYSNVVNPYTSYAGDHTHVVTVDSAGVSGTNANLQPYITVYMWKRTA